jgi:16S rRNA (cytidine1402-2'-O)-methyltransferase
MGILYIVATPIGNLSDITLRAIEVLNNVDLILAEDTRVIRKLLNRFNIEKPVLSYHQHSKLRKINYILNLLKEGKKLALVSDSGTPGISDPGSKLIEEIFESPKLNLLPNYCVKVVPIPGPSALVAAASISGFSMDKFLFLGFPPTKKKRKKFFEKVVTSKYPIVLYESPYRIIKTLKEIKEAQQNCNRKKFRVVVCRELTKLHETIYRGTVEEVLKQLEKEKTRGEFVVIIENR